MSIPTIPRVDFSNTCVVSDYLLGNVAGVATAVRGVCDRGGNVYQFGSKSRVDCARVFAWGMHDFERLCGLGDVPYGVAIVPYFGDGEWSDQYDMAVRDERVSAIAICSGDSELSRLKFFHHLVSGGKFSKAKVHWLYGFSNPAEISAFRSIFSPFVLSRIEMAVCSTSFIYGMYGVSFSSYSGLHLPIPGAYSSRVLDLGMEPWMSYELHRDQLRMFQSNVDMVQAYSQGVVCADDYVDSARDFLSL